MNGVHFMRLRNRDDSRDVQVGFHGALARADLVGLIRLKPVKRQPVFIRINGDGAQAKFVGGAEDADGDFAAVGSQQFADGTMLFHVNQSTRPGAGCEILYFCTG